MKKELIKKEEEIGKKNDENVKLEQKVKECEEKVKVLEHATNILSSTKAASSKSLNKAKSKSKRPSRDLSLIYQTAELRTKGRNSVNSMQRLPYSYKTTFDVYKTGAKSVCEKRSQDDHNQYERYHNFHRAINITYEYSGRNSNAEYNNSSSSGKFTCFKANAALQGINVTQICHILNRT